MTSECKCKILGFIGQRGIIRPDGEVRISVKVLATNCIVNLVTMSPEVFCLTLSHTLVDAGTEMDQQKIDDLCLYATHSDPLLRGSIYVLAGAFVRSTILNSNAQSSQLPENLMNILKEVVKKKQFVCHRNIYLY